ncbi:MAG TPA: nucleotidyltransferase [Microscillaceae bacterium]|nr:nucleotidyltransferase [Microscillaceae bacterium]
MAKRTVEQGFVQLLKNVEALKGAQSKVKKHKDSVKNCLYEKLGCVFLPETGSFGNGTEVRHHSDSDFFAVLPKKEASNDSNYVLRKVKNALKGRFSTTSEISIDCPSVKIPFGYYASETMEITPCYIDSNQRIGHKSYRVYGIPDYKEGWMFSSPQVHNYYVKQNDIRLHFRLKPLIKLVKTWKYYNKVRLHSFYLELRCTKAMHEEKIIYSFDSYLLKSLKYLKLCKLAKIQDPMGISGLVASSKTDNQKEGAWSKLNTAVSRAEKAVAARKKGDIDKAFEEWDKFFNGKFPKR